MKQKGTLLFAGIAILIAVILGAMGAHYLKETLTFPLDKIESWKTGVLYQFLHGLSLIIVTILGKTLSNVSFKKTVLFLKIGIILFSGSIYGLTLNYSWKFELLPKFLGPLTPLGGLCLIIGWTLFIVTVLKINLENAKR